MRAKPMLFVICTIVIVALCASTAMAYDAYGPYVDSHTKTGPTEIDGAKWSNGSDMEMRTKFSRSYSSQKKVWGTEQAGVTVKGKYCGWSVGFNYQLTNGQEYTETVSTTVTVDPIIVAAHTWKELTVYEWRHQERNYFEVWYNTLWGPNTGYMEPERWREWSTYEYSMRGGPLPKNGGTPKYGKQPVGPADPAKVSIGYL